ncbi:hypothetical protein [Acetomicrobium sp.]|uniref:hypothetical protein n=1 Tax=Acetomicrobium sp. TaxID=1872099 RepID=UPI002FCBD828
MANHLQDVVSEMDNLEQAKVYYAHFLSSKTDRDRRKPLGYESDTRGLSLASTKDR